jgi:Cys-tRNA(Pro)/Cys-tRNA(Cys) deacylase
MISDLSIENISPGSCTAMTPAIEATAAAGIKIGVHPYAHDPDNQKYGLEAAEALGVPLAHIFKTLVIDIGAAMESRYALAVEPVPRTLKLKAAAAALGQKKAVVRLLTTRSALRVTCSAGSAP